MLSRLFFLSSFCFITLLSWSQNNVGINTTSPDASAVLDVSSTSQGLLVPRMTTTQRNAIASPATGLLVFDLSTTSFWYFDGTSWVDLDALESNDWSTSGNTGTDPTSDFIGTTDFIDLNFRVNNQTSGKISPSGNVHFGYQVGLGSSGTSNIFMGTQSGYTNTGSANTFIGSASGTQIGYSTSTVLIGNYAGNNAGSLSYDVGIGSWALHSASTGTGYNIAIGDQSGRNLGFGSGRNVLIGSQSGENLTGTSNVMIGDYAGQNVIGTGNVGIGKNTSNTPGNYNIAIGEGAGYVGSGDDGVAIGHNTPIHTETIAIGAQASGGSITDNSVFVGHGAGTFSSSLANSADNAVVIGHEAAKESMCDYSVIIGKNAGQSAVGSLGLPYSVAIGYNAGYNLMGALGLSDDLGNVQIGYEAGHCTGISGGPRQQNVLIGSWAGHTLGGLRRNVILGTYASGVSALNNGGDENVIIGYRAGESIDHGDGNIVIGHLADGNGTIAYDTNGYPVGFQHCIAIGDNAQFNAIGAPETVSGMYNAIAIGYQSLVEKSNSMAIGGTAHPLKVGINTSTPDKELDVEGDAVVTGFTTLGTGAPGIKMVKLTGITPAFQGNSISVAHGVADASKILAVDVHVEYATDYSVTDGYTTGAGYQFDYYLTPTHVYIWLTAGNSANIVGDPYRILLTVEE